MKGLILKESDWYIIENVPEYKGTWVQNQEVADKIINDWALKNENFSFTPMVGEYYPVEVEYEIIEMCAHDLERRSNCR